MIRHFKIYYAVTSVKGRWHTSTELLQVSFKKYECKKVWKLIMNCRLHEALSSILPTHTQKPVCLNFHVPTETQYCKKYKTSIHMCLEIILKC